MQTAKTCTIDRRPKAPPRISVPVGCRPDKTTPSWTKTTPPSLMWSLAQAFLNTVKRRLSGDALKFFLRSVRVPCSRLMHSRTCSSAASSSSLRGTADSPNKIELASSPARVASIASPSGKMVLTDPARSTIVITRASGRLLVQLAATKRAVQRQRRKKTPSPMISGEVLSGWRWGNVEQNVTKNELFLLLLGQLPLHGVFVICRSRWQVTADTQILS